MMFLKTSQQQYLESFALQCYQTTAYYQQCIINSKTTSLHSAKLSLNIVPIVFSCSLRRY